MTIRIKNGKLNDKRLKEDVGGNSTKLYVEYVRMTKEKLEWKSSISNLQRADGIR